MYIPTIGLEIHIELKTATKMFCGCRNDPDEKRPNVNVCPICLAHPGTLPVINREAVAAVIKTGLALGGTVAERSHFDRKSYFYPDLPKGYQISQYEAPLIKGGILNGVRITRIHLEEDTGRLLHGNYDDNDDRGQRDHSHSQKSLCTLVDFNRAGLPLMELVTEPDIKNAREAVAFARELQQILRYLGVSDGDMEKGHMRVEANISLCEIADPRGNDQRQSASSQRESAPLGTKVEVKNLNSFRAVGGAIAYELERQEKLLKRGGKVAQETRGWNDKKGVTESQRSKESSHDYRYFPEPDLPPIHITVDGRASPAFAGGPPTDEIDVGKIKAEIPELPEAKRKRFAAEFGFAPEQAGLVTADMALADYFEQAASEFKALMPKADYQLLFNYLTSDLLGLMGGKGMPIGALKVSPEHLAHLVSLIGEGKLSSRLAKDLLAKMFETGEDPGVLMTAEGLRVMGDEGELTTVVREVIEKNPKAVGDYRKGKGNALQFLVGQAMARTRGQADPGKLKELFEKELGRG